MEEKDGHIKRGHHDGSQLLETPRNPMLDSNMPIMQVDQKRNERKIMYIKKLKSTSNAYGTPTKSITRIPPMEEAGASKPNMAKVMQEIECGRKEKAVR